MKRLEALAHIRKAGYMGDYKKMIELRVIHRIAAHIATKEFNLGVNIKKSEIEKLKFDSQYNSSVLNNS